MARNQPSGSELEITLEILRAIEDNETVTQRSAAQKIGVALGLVNTYFKRCVKKGYIKVTQVPANRYAYYLTPKGFSEKSRLTAEFLSQSLSLYRQAQQQYLEILERGVEQRWQSIALVGVSDLAEIVALCSKDYPIAIAGVVDAAAADADFRHAPVVESWQELDGADVFVLTSLENPQAVYDRLIETLPPEKVMVPRLLGVQQKQAAPARAGKRGG